MRNPIFLLALLLALTSCTRVNVFPQDERAQPASAKNAVAAPDKPKDEDKGPFKPWDEVLKDTRAVDGLVKLHLKRDRSLYAELRPDQLGKDFGMFLHFSRGLGDFFAYDGLYLTGTRVIRFERVGDQIHLVHRNTRFIAEEDSPTETSLEDNIGHSILEAAKIESQHPESKNVLINLSDFFVSDYAEISDLFKSYFGSKPVSFEKKSSYVENVMGFPENLEIDVALTFKASGPPIQSPDAVSDYRSMPVAVRYSIFRLPEDPMRPRLADDRVGHFIDSRKDFSRDQDPNPYLHYVNRWRLEKKDPSAAISEPVQPIVYYIDRSVPKRYRRWVKEGIEGWNKAFEAAGFENAVVAREAPEDDSTWSAEDMRYSTVQWTAAHRMGFAIGPSQTDPRTGEILNADVLVSSSFVRGWANEFAELGPRAIVDRVRDLNMLHRRLPPPFQGSFCMAESGAAMQIGFQHAVMTGLGELAPGEALPEAYLGDAIRWLIMHEIGHTLGLRHNFKASSGIPYDKLNDKAFTQDHGLILSVMDYPPVNVSADRSRQGHYWSPVVGTYDDWAVRYAYAQLETPSASGTNGHEGFDPFDELPQLREIAEEASEPMHVYGTDEDNWLGTFAIDPDASAWELGSDVLRYARDRGRLVRTVTPELEERLIAPGEPYHRLRGARVSMLVERLQSLLPATKVVGGVYHIRDHKGDPGDRTPFRAIPAGKQREALRLVVNEIFAADAFSFEPEMLDKLAPDRMWYFNYSMPAPVDFPAHEYVDAVQSIFINELMDPARFQRINNNELRSPDDAFTASEMLQTLTGAIWAELDRGVPVSSFRRNLQRRYTDQLIRLMHDSPPWRVPSGDGFTHVATPEHVRSLSRLELTELLEKIDAVEEVDRDTEAHLLETRARIDRALKASIVSELP